MNKNKLIVMVVTFAVLIALTPLIFSKLMNAKLNQMIENYKKKGYKVELLSDKSTYLQTDKVFLVTLPSKDLKPQGVKDLTLVVETVFKNLPITDVKFDVRVKKIDFIAPNMNSLAEFVEKNIHAKVITPNFKVYAYKLDDIKIKNSFKEMGLENIRGTFKSGEDITNSLLVSRIYTKDNGFEISVNNFTYEFKKHKDSSKSDLSFNMFIKTMFGEYKITNVYLSNLVELKKLAFISAKLGVMRVDSKSIKLNDFKVVFSLNDIPTEILKEIAIKSDDETVAKIFEHGFKFKLTSSLKDVVWQKDLGGYILEVDVDSLKTPNALEKIRAKDYSFLNVKINIIASKPLFGILIRIVPNLAPFAQFAKEQNGKMVLDLEIKKDKLYIQGKPVQ
ncbi:MAG: hypothetical protein ABGX26_00940 [Nautiliaceae bacterium]